MNGDISLFGTFCFFSRRRFGRIVLLTKCFTFDTFIATWITPFIDPCTRRSLHSWRLWLFSGFGRTRMDFTRLQTFCAKLFTLFPLSRLTRAPDFLNLFFCNFSLFLEFANLPSQLIVLVGNILKHLSQFISK